MTDSNEISTSSDDLSPWTRPVFVFAEGRSGSTLLARLLNCMESLTVWGEHAGIIHQFAVAYRSFTREDFKSFIESQRPWSDALIRKTAFPEGKRGDMTMEWANAFGSEDLIDQLRVTLTQLFTKGLREDRRWGFKEIRYERLEYDFLRLLFPNCQIITLAREPASTLVSQFAHFARREPAQLAVILRRVIAFQDFARDVVSSSEGALVHLDYANLVGDGARVVTRLESFLGERADVRQVGAILAEREAPDSSDTYDRGGAEGVASDLAATFEAHGQESPTEEIAHCVRVYDELRRMALTAPPSVDPASRRSEEAPGSHAELSGL